ncbi:MAG: TIGR01777 family protein [Planctomycetes bacterium]|nr:TIGR01777 family protein [Planctomycetota bacterium]
MRILISGSTGLIGSALVSALQTDGHEVHRLVRRHADAAGPNVFWDPANGKINSAALEGFGAVVHLAGENIAGGRWTRARMTRIRDSRVDSTRLLAGSLAQLRQPPEVLLSASAIGIYGNRPGEELSEKSTPGEGFLADVCRQWEAAAQEAAGAGIRVVALRFGMVLAGGGGALAKMLPPFRLGLGGPVGSGRQEVSWIAVDDAVAAAVHLLGDSTTSGPVNLVAPRPVTNRRLAKSLGRVLHRPALMPLPALAARIVLGRMADELLLASQRVVPRRLLEAGFQFNHPELDAALRYLLDR